MNYDRLCCIKRRCLLEELCIPWRFEACRISEGVNRGVTVGENIARSKNTRKMTVHNIIQYKVWDQRPTLVIL